MEIDKDGTVWVGYHNMENFIRVRNDSIWIYRGLKGIGFKTVTTYDIERYINWSKEKIIYYSTNEGLLSNSITGLYADNHNRIWITSDLGINSVKIS